MIKEIKQKIIDEASYQKMNLQDNIRIEIEDVKAFFRENSLKEYLLIPHSLIGILIMAALYLLLQLTPDSDFNCTDKTKFFYPEGNRGDAVAVCNSENTFHVIEENGKDFEFAGETNGLRKKQDYLLIGQILDGCRVYFVKDHELKGYIEGVDGVNRVFSITDQGAKFYLPGDGYFDAFFQDFETHENTQVGGGGVLAAGSGRARDCEATSTLN